MDAPILLPCEIDVLDMLSRSPRKEKPSTGVNTLEYLEVALPCCAEARRLKPSLHRLKSREYIESEKVEGEQNFYITPNGEKVHEYFASPKKVSYLEAAKLLTEAIKVYQSAGIPDAYGPTEEILEHMLSPHGLNREMVRIGRHLAISGKKVQRILVIDGADEIISEQYTLRVSEKVPDTIRIPKLTGKRRKEKIVRTKPLR